jgi:hypothetical protein
LVAAVIVCYVLVHRMKIMISIWNALLLQGFALVVAGATVERVERAMVCGLYFQGADSVTPYFAFFNSKKLQERDFDNLRQDGRLALLKSHAVVAFGKAVQVHAGIWQGLAELVQRVDGALFPTSVAERTFLNNLSDLADLDMPADFVFSGNSGKKTGAVPRILQGAVSVCMF